MTRKLIVTVLALFLAACEPSGDGGSASDPGARPNFILIDIDSLRADRLHMDHEGEPLTPAMRSLAQRSASFANMFSQSSWTLPALASLLTGRYPPSFTSSNPVHEHVDSLGLVFPEVLRIYGYQTAVAWGDTVPVYFPALSEGFERHLRVRPGRGADPYRDPLVDYLDSEPEEPFFLLVHNLDLHRPVPPPAASFIELHAQEAPLPTCKSLTDAYKSGRKQLGEEAARRRTITCYHAALQSYDQVLGAVFDSLQRSGLRQRTVVIVTSDHGEELYEHGQMGHAELQYDTVLRVPLIISDPALKEPMVLDEIVQTTDLAPTILQRAGISAPHDLQGSSLLPLLGLSQGAYEERDVFSFANTTHATLRTQSRKFHHQVIAGVPFHQLFDTRSDPQERNNIIQQEPEMAWELGERLERFIRERQEQRAASPLVESPDALERELKERGYWEMVREPEP